MTPVASQRSGSTVTSSRDTCSQQADADELGCARHVAERADPDQAGQPVSVGAVGYGGQPPWVRFASRSRAASKPKPSMSSSRANMPQAYGGYAEAAPCQKVTGACRRSRSSPRRTHLANGWCRSRLTPS